MRTSIARQPAAAARKTGPFHMRSQSRPADKTSNCERDRGSVRSRTEGQTQRPRSRRLCTTTRLAPSHQSTLIWSLRRLLRNTTATPEYG